jgi:hypothetical protein
MKVRWSVPVKLITLILVILIVCAEYALIVNDKIILPVALPLSLLLIAIYAPLSMSLNQSELVLKKVIGKIRIPYHQIVTIEPFKFTNDIRIFGSGGFCGYIGIFSNSEKGRYFSCIGKVKQSFFIVTKSGKKYAFSCENAPFVIETIKKLIQHENI